ncbi:hypothetical protein [Vampirovibrio sp.]|uniref:hypothetical protein n=1 Tax=Vampirovibrio sp. TaxID=2717857 RepID=UPI0035943B15
MQEAPRYTLLEIQRMLSQYLDGLLEPEQVQELEGLLSRFPQYVEELRKLKVTREALKTTLQNPVLENAVEQPIWDTIAERLQADRQTGLRVFDPEFVSAYYDGEISAVDSEFIEFETQLFHNAKANEMLAQVGEISERVRQWGYRLESSCSVNFTDSVMSTFLAETGRDGLSGEAPATVALLSAYADQALTPRETIEANRLIESDPQAKLTLTHFNQLSEWVQSVSEQIQSQAPDFWPAIAQTLSKTPEEGGLVVTLDRFRTLKRWAKIAGPIAASVLLAAFLMPGPSSPVTSSSSKDASISALPVRSQQAPAAVALPVSSMPPRDQSEIASVPSTHLNGSGLASAFAANREEASSKQARRVSSVANTIASAESGRRSAPAFQAQESTRSLAPRLVLRPVSKAPSIGAVEPRQSSSPSSDEYLFSSLNEQMPGEDISSMFGK